MITFALAAGFLMSLVGTELFIFILSAGTIGAITFSWIDTMQIKKYYSVLNLEKIGIWAINGMFIDMVILAFMMREESFGTTHYIAIQMIMIMIAIFLGVASKGKKRYEK